jgi:hypothetical protein
MVFRDRWLGAPDVLPGEVHMFPAERGKVSEELVRDIFGLGAERVWRVAPVCARMFTQADNGLALPWHGRVFVNPPYGREIRLWVQKARAEVRERRTELVAALLPGPDGHQLVAPGDRRQRPRRAHSRAAFVR